MIAKNKEEFLLPVSNRNLFLTKLITRMRIVTAVFFALISQSIIAQTTFNFTPYPENSRTETLKDRFTQFKLYSASSQTLFQNLTAADQSDRLVFNLAGQERWDMTLVPRQLKSENYVSTAASGQSASLVQSEILTYGGYYNDDINGAIAMTISNNSIYGFVEKDGHTYFIEPLNYLIPGSDENVYVVYDNHNVIDQGGTCAFHDLKENHEKYIPENYEATEGARMNCWLLEIAIASDFSMFQKYGSIAGVEAHNLGVLNNVQTNYDDEFNEEIQFDIVTQFTVDCAGCDPWSASNNAGTVLSSFRSWGNSGGFGVNFDVGEMWTDRNITSSSGPGVIGVAYVPGICNSNKYHLLEDFTSTAWALRVLTAHELGHNFNSGHDSGGSGFIMAPSVNNTSAWSPNSTNVINNYINSLINSSCIAPCVITAPPIADFTSDVTSGCEPLVVNYFDLSLNNPTSWNWTFPGGNPATSTDQNPTVIYPNPGVYDAALQVGNSAGANTSTQFNYIEVYVQPVANFDYAVSGRTVVFNNLSVGDFYTWDFGDGSMSIEENPFHTYLDDGVYTVTLTVENACGAVTATEQITIITAPLPNFTSDIDSGCVVTTVVFMDQSTTNATDWAWSFPGGNPATSNSQFPVITYSNPGSYDVTLEVSNAAGMNSITRVGYITVLPNPIANFTYLLTDLTMDYTNNSTDADNYLWDFGDGNTSTDINPMHTYSAGGTYTTTLTAFSPCDTVTTTQTVNISVVPVAGATADATTGCIPLQVNFTDLTTSAPTSWSWTFEGGTPATSAAQNPTVDYNSAGTFDVELIATNTAGSDTITLTDYITVGALPTSGFNYSTTGTNVDFTNNSTGATTYSWDFGDGNNSTDTNPTHDFGTDGTYTVILTATNSCGDVTSMETVVIVTAPTSGATANVTSGCADLIVQFTDQSSANTTAWAWQFPGGNPSTSTDQNPLVTYSSAGVYDVILTASNSAGNDVTNLSNYIIVDDVPDADFNVAVADLTATFSNNTSNGNSYSWDFGDGNSSSDENPTHTYNADGTYTVTLMATNGCGDDIFTRTVNISNAPNAGATANVTDGCTPFTVQFTDLSSSNTTSWNWIFPGGTPATSNQQNPTVVYNNPGVFDVTLEAINAAGNNTITLDNYITVGIAPTADFSSSSNQLQVDFTNNSTDGNSYSWDFGDGNNSAQENPTHTYDADGTYTVILTVTNNCGSESHTELVTVVSTPIAGFSLSGTNGCEPFTVQMTDQSSSNSTSWNWYFPGGTPSSSILQNPVVVYNEAGNYDVELTVTNAAGSNTLLEENIISVGVGPTADFTSAVDLLQVDFTNDSSNGNIYSWDFGDGNTSNQENPTHTYDADGTYTVVLSVTNDCGTETHTETITVVSTPLANFSISGANGCAPFTVQMTDQSSSNATSWSWSFPGGTPSSSTEQNPVVVYNSAGIYDVELTVTNAAGSNTSTQQNLISVGEGPTAGFTNSENGLTVTFANSSSNTNSYLWDFGDGNSSMDENPVHTYDTEAIYTVTLSVTNDCGTDIFTSQVNLTTIPLAGFNTSGSSGCEPLTVSFTDNSSGTVTSWNWTFEGGTPSTSTDQNPVVQYDTPGIYDVSLTVSSSAGSDTQTQLDYVEVLAQPMAGFDVSFDELVYTFSNTSMNGNTYSWDFGDGNTSNQEDAIHTYATDGVYIVTMSVTNSCGTDTETMTVEAVSAPVGAFSVDNPNGCAPYTVTMIDESSSNVTSWNWSFDGGTPATSTEQNPTVTYSAPGIYTISLEVANSASTFTATRLDYIMVDDSPIAAFDATVNDNEVTFTNNSTGANTYSWDFGDGNSSIEQNPIHVYMDNGTYDVILEVTNNCGTVTETMTIEINNVTLPSAGFTASQNQGCAPLEVQFTDNSSANTDSWLWTFEGGTPSTSTDQNPTVVYQNTGTYSVTLVVENAAGSDELNLIDYINVEDIPSATFNYAAQNLEVDFTADDVNANSYNWEFGDGNTSTDMDPVHEYAADGTYLVTLTVTNNCGTTTSEQTIMVANGVIAPTANFTTKNPTGCVPFTVDFIDNSTNNPTTWNWTFEGGIPATSTEQNPTVVYNQTGKFNVTLTAGNAAGQNELSIDAYITVEDIPTADFTVVDLTDGLFQFNDASTNVDVWTWDFGDGTTGEGQNVEHEFTEEGMFEVVLTVRNDCGENQTSQTVNVTLTNVNTIDEISRFSLFPNPTAGRFQVFLSSSETVDVTLEIFNLIGQLQNIDTFRLSGEMNRNYGFGNQTASGTYFVKISTANGAVYRKIILAKD